LNLGGISSYSAILLIVAYMNNFKLQQSAHITPSRLLMGFLDFYSNCFDPKIYGVNTLNDM
jgi:DNA polymerase sigma